MLCKPFNLGKLQLPNNIFYAPLAGCSDYPFRQMSARYKPGLFFCEMVKMDAIVRFEPNTFHMLDYEAAMHPIGAQLCGSNPKLAGPSAKIIEDLGFDVVDLNCGCPVDKVTKDGSGSGLLKNPQLIGELVCNMVAAVKIPVTIKIRTGWDEKSINAPEITKIAEQAGAKAITIHGRTREQGYSGSANWDHIRSCKEVAKEIIVIGNGDIVDGESAKRIFEHTGCDAILIGRGTMGKPWIVEDVISFLEGNQLQDRSIQDYKKALSDHFQNTVNYHHERRALVDMRRIGCWYIKKSCKTRDFRGLISKASSLEEVQELINSFAFE